MAIRRILAPPNRTGSLAVRGGVNGGGGTIPAMPVGTLFECFTMAAKTIGWAVLIAGLAVAYVVALYRLTRDFSRWASNSSGARSPGMYSSAVHSAVPSTFRWMVSSGSPQPCVKCR